MMHFQRLLFCVLLSWYGHIFAGYQVSGTITDYILKAPAESCLVMLEGLSPNTKTDSIRTGNNGGYAFADVPAGAYEVRIANSRFVPDSMWTILRGDSVFNFTLYATAHVLQTGNVPDTLKKSGSPYLVLTLVRITKPLTISAGTKIVFFKNSSLEPADNFSAEGSLDDSILFTGDYEIPNRDSLAAHGGSVHSYMQGGSFAFKYCKFENLSEIALRFNPPYHVSIENCLFNGMNMALGINSMPSPHLLTFKNNRVINCTYGVMANSSPSVDSIELSDNLLQCSNTALSLMIGKKASLRRNTVLGPATVNLQQAGSAGDTIVSNIFSALYFQNTSGKSLFFAYNDMITLTGQAPMGIGSPAIVNAKGDSCDFYYNIRKKPLFADSTTGVLNTNSPCIRTGFGGENIGVYQGTGVGIRQNKDLRRESPIGFRVLSARRGAAGILLTASAIPLAVKNGTKLSIYDIFGRKLPVKPLMSIADRSGFATTAIFIPQFCAVGSYVLEITSGGGSYFTRFTIDR